MSTSLFLIYKLYDSNTKKYKKEFKLKNPKKVNKWKRDWEKNNPEGGNPADAKEYLSDSLELKEWLIKNPYIAHQKTQMFQIVCQQMILALKQLRGGRVFPHEDFGHHNEIQRRNTKAKDKPNDITVSVATQKAQPIQKQFYQPIAIAKSTKLKDKVLDKNEKIETLEIEKPVEKHVEIKFSDILKEQKQKEESQQNSVNNENSNAQNATSYDSILKRMSENRATDKKSEKTKLKPIVTAAIILLTVVAVLYFLMF
jgi:hypothetical protein